MRCTRSSLLQSRNVFGISSSIQIGPEIQCLLYAGFLKIFLVSVRAGFFFYVDEMEIWTNSSRDEEMEICTNSSRAAQLFPPSFPLVGWNWLLALVLRSHDQFQASHWSNYYLSVPPPLVGWNWLLASYRNIPIQSVSKVTNTRNTGKYIIINIKEVI